MLSGEGAPDSGAEVPLHTVERIMVEQAAHWLSWQISMLRPMDYLILQLVDVA